MDEPVQSKFIKPLIHTISRPGQVEKIHRGNSAIINAQNSQSSDFQTIGHTVKTEKGRVMIVTSGPSERDIAKELLDFMTSYDVTVDARTQIDNVKKLVPTTHHFAAVCTFPAQGGAFDVVTISSADSLMFAYHPKTRKEDHLALVRSSNSIQHNRMKLAEGTIIVCLTGEILKYIPKLVVHQGHPTEELQAINIVQMIVDGFRFPEEVTESSLIAALIDFAAQQKKHLGRRPQAAHPHDKTEEKTPVHQNNFFIASLGLSNDLKTNSFLSPANWTPFIVATLGIAFGLKAFDATWFLSAAPYLTSIVLVGTTIAVIALLLYIVDTIITDMYNQWESRAVESSDEVLQQHPDLRSEVKVRQEGTMHHLYNYATGVPARIKDWLYDHSFQFIIGMTATAFMAITLLVALEWIFDPVGLSSTLAGPSIKIWFDLMADTITSIASAYGVTLGVGSINVLVALISILSVGVIFDTARRIGTYIYEKPKDINTPHLEVWMAQDHAGKERPLVESVELTGESNPVNPLFRAPKKAVPNENYYVVLKGGTHDNCLVRIIGLDEPRMDF